MKDTQQLIKNNSQEGRCEDVLPKTFIDAVEDIESGDRYYYADGTEALA